MDINYPLLSTNSQTRNITKGFDKYIFSQKFLEITTFSRKCSPRQHLVMHFIAYTLSSWYNYINI